MRPIQLKPHYARSGPDMDATFGKPGSLFSIDGRLKLGDLVLPLLARFDFGITRTRPYLIAGPYQPLKFRARVSLVSEIGGMGQDIRTRNVGDRQKTDLGVVLGCGVRQSLERGACDPGNLFCEGSQTSVNRR